MRYLFLLLLSFPAYSATIEVNAPVTWHVAEAPFIGDFTIANNVITHWEFSVPGLIEIRPFGSNTDCGQFANPGECQKAQIVAPDHLFFFWAISPANHTELDLYFNGPLREGASISELSDFRYSYNREHVGTLFGIVHAPEPKPVTILGTILGMWLIVSMLARYMGLKGYSLRMPKT